MSEDFGPALDRDRALRLRRFHDLLAEHELDAAFCPPSGDLEYLTGFPRRAASFGNFEYANQWIAGAWFRPGQPPVYVIPQGYAAFNLPDGVAGDVRSVANADDADAMMAALLGSFGPLRRIGVSARTMSAATIRFLSVSPGVRIVDLDEILVPLRAIKSDTELAVLQASSRICDAVMADITASLRPGRTEYEIAAEVDLLAKTHGGRTPSFDTGVFSMGPGDDRDASARVSARPLREGLSVSFDFGTVLSGYCSDFGRTIHLGEPGSRYREVYEVVMAAQQAGRRAAIPGAVFRDVHQATRSVIDEAGYGQWFRHRTGHCIGLDTHERPFVSEESDWVLREGMTFTIEPSVFHPGTVGVRVEDIFVCRPGGAVSLNDYPYDLVAV